MRKIYSKENQVEKYGFVKTKEKVEVTFNGWDGKSYDGESKVMNVWTCPTHPGKKFVYKRQGGFVSAQNGTYKIDAVFEITDRMVENKKTGIEHPVVEYFWSEEVPYVEY